MQLFVLPFELAVLIVIETCSGGSRAASQDVAVLFQLDDIRRRFLINISTHDKF